MMYNFKSKSVFFAGSLAVLLLLSGCGLNQRSAATDDPVIVQPLQDDGQQGDDGSSSNEANSGESNDGSGSTTDQQTQDQNNNNNNEGAVDEGAGDSNQQDQTAGDSNTGEQQDETPREEPQATEAPANPQPTAAPAQPEPTAVPTAAPSADGARTHIVAAGQTLFSIAQSYGLTVSELAAANGIVNPNVLAVGEELAIPVPGTVVLPETASVHIVGNGETLFRIAQRYGLTVDELAIYNNISNINRIDVGQEIKIPTQ